MLKHVTRKAFWCKYCNFDCDEEVELKCHMESHIMLVCPKCAFSAISEEELQSHATTHTGEKPFECKQCDFRCEEEV